MHSAIACDPGSLRSRVRTSFRPASGAWDGIVAPAVITSTRFLSRLCVASKDSASALSAELPTALMLWTTPAPTELARHVKITRSASRT